MKPRDPETFGTQALVERLQSQRSVEEMHHRQETRRNAKVRLNSLLEPEDGKPTQTPKNQRRSFRYSELPEWKADLVRELKSVMKANRHEGGEVFDMESLGFRMQNSTQAG